MPSEQSVRPSVAPPYCPGVAEHLRERSHPLENSRAPPAQPTRPMQDERELGGSRGKWGGDQGMRTQSQSAGQPVASLTKDLHGRGRRSWPCCRGCHGKAGKRRKETPVATPIRYDESRANPPRPPSPPSSAPPPIAPFPLSILGDGHLQNAVPAPADVDPLRAHPS